MINFISSVSSLLKSMHDSKIGLLEGSWPANNKWRSKRWKGRRPCLQRNEIKMEILILTYQTNKGVKELAKAMSLLQVG